MDWMQFVSALVSALAWPAAVVMVVCLLKNPILGLIPKIRSFKYGELHVDLTEQLKSVQENLPDTPSEPDANAPPSLPPPTAIQLAAISPRAAIMHSWFGVVNAIDLLVRKLGLEINANINFKMDVLRKRGVIDDLTFSTFRQLSKVRNDAVHLTDHEMGYEDAVMMSTSCAWLIEQLQKGTTPAEAVI